MALGDQLGLQAVQAAVAQIPGLKEFLGEKVSDLHAALSQTLTTGITQIGDTEKSVIDYGLKEVAALLNSQRAALLSEVDRRFLGVGVILEALGQAMKANAAPVAPDAGT